MNEDYWEDVTVYNVSFRATDDRLINKVLVFPTSYTELAVKESIEKNFFKLKKIERIEEFQEALLISL
ncbi:MULTISPECIES: hypothetical protein [Carnobacterium]|uniref:hypothetical protein n=1 Tax=Carnobacterium TaxID=2747 RepID=UPI0007F43AA3|nr:MULTISPECIES: hypothetical protein [Carnobacterium]MCO6019034.1 hypothetical protein [Carnobacterium divergens]MDT1940707.1 hypothetical protein [Carnobacterium divergens]MDT1943145.1 hypothetical protein [Carnobacterium divergens]MDT1948952.1 hypothetical protein [Carnobacterium divergens]MDT1951433.1 hypothetical protein [Carnobacterium divergens]